MLTACASEPERPDILLVVADTLRADHLGTYGYDRPTSPAIDALAAESVVFENAFASSPWTLPTFGSLLTGRIPPAHRAGRRLSGRPWNSSGLDQRGSLGPDVPTIAEELRAAGYQTALFGSNPFLGDAFGLGRGFEVYDNAGGRRADQVVDLVLDWFSGQAGASEGAAEPRFALVHLMDPHLPYAAPAEVEGTFASSEEGAAYATMPVAKLRRRVGTMTPTVKQHLIDRYDEEILFLDRQVGRLVDGLRAEAGDRSVVVIFTSDHGEELFDHGYFEHGHSLFQELLRVPLLVRAEDVAPRRDATPVTTADIAATVLELADITRSGAMDGESLWPLLRKGEALDPRALYAGQVLYGGERSALIRWPWKLVLNEVAGTRSLYDLESDPSETLDRAASEPEISDRLESELRQLIAANDEGRESEIELDEKTARELKALGYLD